MSEPKYVTAAELWEKATPWMRFRLALKAHEREVAANGPNGPGAFLSRNRVYHEAANCAQSTAAP